MKTVLTITVLVIAGLSLLMILLKTVLHQVSRKMEAAIQARFDRHDILAASTRANFFGRKSRGGRQIRGNGALVLTREKVYFLRAVPEKEYEIPIHAVTEVTLPKNFNGKSIFRPLLCVQYRGDDGPDAMAWAVREPQQWKAAIENLMYRERTSAT